MMRGRMDFLQIRYQGAWVLRDSVFDQYLAEADDVIHGRSHVVAQLRKGIRQSL
jgi:hypothetical protein